MFNELWFNCMSGIIHLATAGLQSGFSRSLLGWRVHPAEDQEYLPQIPAVHSEEPLVLGSLCAQNRNVTMCISYKIQFLLLQTGSMY